MFADGEAAWLSMGRLFREAKWPFYVVQTGCLCGVNGILSEGLSANLCAGEKITGTLLAYVANLL